MEGEEAGHEEISFLPGSVHRGWGGLWHRVPSLELARLAVAMGMTRGPKGDVLEASGFTNLG